MSDPFEADQEDNAVGELYGVGEFDIPYKELVDLDIIASETDTLQRALGAYYILQLDNIRRAARATRENNEFLLAAFRRNGVL